MSPMPSSSSKCLVAAWSPPSASPSRSSGIPLASRVRRRPLDCPSAFCPLGPPQQSHTIFPARTPQSGSQILLPGSARAPPARSALSRLTAIQSKQLRILKVSASRFSFFIRHRNQFMPFLKDLTLHPNTSSSTFVKKAVAKLPHSQNLIHELFFAPNQSLTSPQVRNRISFC